MLMERPGKTDGMRHVALFTNHYEASERFYTQLLGMDIEWRPDADNVYLTNGNDNLALHRVEHEASKAAGAQQLDHIGFFINNLEKIDVWFTYLKSEGVHMFTEPRTHRDGARSFYCADPAGVRVQIIYHPPIANAGG
jgi:catechol 2,3-dioxygenase-like lactoylglutathione lyase family enzyme|tara:strand:- start:8841 stop:9254 length:414 start_codon:yes stop_codon:yes gene_type:complete